MTGNHFIAEQHTMVRVDIATGLPFDDFQPAFEKAAPWFDLAAVTRIVEEGGDWRDVVVAAEANAPNGLMIYWRIDASPVLHVAGHQGHAVEYLLGNHVLAESMYRHDHRAMLYAPLRILLHADDDGNAIFSLDRPSTVFAGLNHPGVAEVGAVIEGKVAALLRVLGVDTDGALAVGPEEAARHGDAVANAE
jgi:uncharacterized protein (DUF302 family)